MFFEKIPTLLGTPDILPFLWNLTYISKKSQVYVDFDISRYISRYVSYLYPTSISVGQRSEYR